MSSDIHLELEDDTSPAAGVSPPTSPPPGDIDDHISSVLSYHPRQALNKAILDWIAQVLNISRTLDTAPQTLLQPADALAPPINDLTLSIDKTSSEYVSDVLLSEPLDTLVETQENISYKYVPCSFSNMTNISSSFLLNVNRLHTCFEDCCIQDYNILKCLFSALAFLLYLCPQ